jgi:BirA family transcriptional regulator, biotin operon repressor / biotin---[acetyl-CoA-carboxylase] ligase
MHLLTTTTSTNDEAKRGAQSGAPHGATWVTEEQSAGRGRQGRGWEAARGESLLFSVLLRLDCLPARLPLLSLLSGLIVREAVAQATPGAQVGLKWPNDVVAQVRREGAPQTLLKLSGVLVEAITSGSRVQAVVVGVGINVHSRHFPESIAARATSVALLQPQGSPPPDRAEILADVLCRLDRDLHVVLARGLGMVRSRLEAADTLRGRSVRGGGHGGEEGVAAGIDDDGRLVVRLAGGDIARWSAGEVHLMSWN